MGKTQGKAKPVAAKNDDAVKKEKDHENVENSIISPGDKFSTALLCTLFANATARTITPHHDHRGVRWLSSFYRNDPRWQIMKYFDEVAMKGRPGRRGTVFNPNSTLLRKKANIFTVWRPTSLEAIKNMMLGKGTGKAIDIKGKSARGGNISSFVPFIQIYEDQHKEQMQAFLRDDKLIRVYFEDESQRDGAREIMLGIRKVMLLDAQFARKIWAKISTGVPVSNAEKGAANYRHRRKVDDDNLKLEKVDKYAPEFFGLDVGERLFWEAYVIERDCSRPMGTEWHIRRKSSVHCMNGNLNSTRKAMDAQSSSARRVVAYQKCRSDPMEPRMLLVAYEENDTVLPVVSDFDLFLLGSRRLDYKCTISDEHLELLQWLIRNIREFLDEQNNSPRKKNIEWTEYWPDVIRRSSLIDGFYPQTPEYGHGDPVSYNIIRHAAERLRKNGCVRHGPECFNFHFPQDIDEEFLVVCDALPSNIRNTVPWKYVNVNELQELLIEMIDNDFTFPINPKWILCDPGWKRVYDKLMASDNPNVQESLDCWFPQGTNIREEIELISAKYPSGLNGGVPEATSDGTSGPDSDARMKEQQGNRRGTMSQEDEEILRKKIQSQLMAEQELVKNSGLERRQEVETDNETMKHNDGLGTATHQNVGKQSKTVEFQIEESRFEAKMEEGNDNNISNNNSTENTIAAHRGSISAPASETRDQIDSQLKENDFKLQEGQSEEDSHCDLRRQILNCFDEVVQENKRQDLTGKASVFTVWCDKTPEEAMKKMMMGVATGKGLDIKLPCATRGNINTYVPLLPLCEDNHHKEMTWNSLRDGEVFRVFYRSQHSRMEAGEKLLLTKACMLHDMRLINDKYSNPTENELFMRNRVCNTADLEVIMVDDYAPKVYALDVSERLLWEAYVMQQDCTRPEGSEWDLGIDSALAVTQLNINSLQNTHTGFFRSPEGTKAVLYQIDESSPMEPRTLVMAYEERGDVKPVVQDLDCLLFATRGVQFDDMSQKQLQLMKWCLRHIEESLEKQKSTRQQVCWPETWFEVFSSNKETLQKFHPVPLYGFGDPVTYRIFENVIKRLQATGCVRHGAECFNYFFPKQLEDSFLVISDTLPGDTPWKYVNVKELQDLLCDKIDEGYTFPLNPKWVLWDSGWKQVYKKLLASDNLNIQYSLKGWLPPESGVRKDIDRIWNEYSPD